MMTQTPEVLDYASTHQRLFDAGYLPIPILPNTKRPARMDWANDDYHLAQGCHGYGVGILCGRGQGPIVAIDIDVLDESLAMEIAAHVTHTHGMTLSRVGLEPKIMLLYRADNAGYRKLRSTEYGCGHVEIMGYGQQIVAFGKHPDTKKDYQWPGLLGSILEVPARSLPVLTMDQIKAIIKSSEQIIMAKGYQPKALNEKPASATDYDPDDPLDQKPALGWTLDQARAFVDKLNPDASRDQWIQIGMALHHEFDGSEDAMEVWDSWSSKGSKYKEGEPEKQWESFARPGFRGRPVTAAYILDLVKKVSPEAAKTTEQKETELNFFKRLNWSTTRFVDEPPLIPMVVDNMIVKGIVGLFYSPGGAGKSTILLHLCVKIALAKHYPQSFFGNQIHGGQVVIVTAEDPDVIINRRFVGCVQSVAAENNADYKDVRTLVDGGLSIVSTFGHCVQLFCLQPDGTLKASNYYTSLLEALSEVPDLQMVVIDTKTRYSPGEGTGNVTATQEISYYEGLAQKLDATVMLLHHTDKASRKGNNDAHAYRDASALYDSVRGAWLLRSLSEEELQVQGLKPEDASKYLMLKNDKNNYIQLHEPLLIHRDGYSYTKRTIAPKLSNIEKKEARVQAAFDIVVRLMQELGEGEISQADVLRAAREENLSRNKVLVVLAGMLEDGLVETVPSRGRAVIYQLTDAGKRCNLTIGES